MLHAYQAYIDTVSTHAYTNTRTHTHANININICLLEQVVLATCHMPNARHLHKRQPKTCHINTCNQITTLTRCTTTIVISNLQNGRPQQRSQANTHKHAYAFGFGFTVASGCARVERCFRPFLVVSREKQAAAPNCVAITCITTTKHHKKRRNKLIGWRTRKVAYDLVSSKRTHTNVHIHTHKTKKWSTTIGGKNAANFNVRKRRRKKNVCFSIYAYTIVYVYMCLLC